MQLEFSSCQHGLLSKLNAGYKEEHTLVYGEEFYAHGVKEFEHPNALLCPCQQMCEEEATLVDFPVTVGTRHTGRTSEPVKMSV